MLLIVKSSTAPIRLTTAASVMPAPFAAASISSRSSPSTTSITNTGHAKAHIQKFCALPGMRLLGDGLLTAASPGVGSKLPHHPPAGEVVISMRPVSVFANGPRSEFEKVQAGLHGRWREAARAVMVLLSQHGLLTSQIADLLDCQPDTVPHW